MLAMLPVYVGMLVAHRHTHPVSAGFALLLSMLATGGYISSNAAIPMLELAQRHAAATTDLQRWALVGAGEAVLARGEDFTPGTFIAWCLSGLAAIVVSVVMLRGRVFSRTNAWAGIAGFSFLTLFTFVATFVQAWYVVAFYLFGGAGGLLALAWFRHDRTPVPDSGGVMPVGARAHRSRGAAPSAFGTRPQRHSPLRDSDPECPDMLREHEVIGAAAVRLEEVARQEENTHVERLARTLQLHARTEEEVYYPAAILVGKLIRMHDEGRQ